MRHRPVGIGSPRVLSNIVNVPTTINRTLSSLIIGKYTARCTDDPKVLRSTNKAT